MKLVSWKALCLPRLLKAYSGTQLTTSVVSSLCTCNEKPQYTRILSTVVEVLRGNMLGKPFKEGNTARLVFAPIQGSRPGRPYGSHNYTLLLSVSMKNIFHNKPMVKKLVKSRYPNPRVVTVLNSSF